MSGEPTVTFDDGAAYEQLMRGWTTSVGTEFLDWLAAPNAADWLDVGCGTGLFTGLVAERCAPRSLTGIDPAEAQLEAANASVGSRAEFRTGDARALPLPEDAYDVSYPRW